MIKVSVDYQDRKHGLGEGGMAKTGAKSLHSEPLTERLELGLEGL